MFLTILLIATLIGLILLGCILVVLRGVSSPRSMLFGPVVFRGAPGHGRNVALSFDDGPDAEYTGQILDILQAHQVSAAFFVIGRYAETNQDLITRIQAEGHVIGNHSYSHSHLGSFRYTRYWEHELARTDQVVHSAIGLRPTLIRPPMGLRNPLMMKAFRRGGYTTVTWSCRGLDGVTTTAKKILDRLSKRVEAGSIIVLHDGTDPFGKRDPHSTIEALPRIIADVRSQGLEFVRLDKLIDVVPYR
jgi:peptidoglycan/xylan/chitin deacetylase (PgdA/CDA1 family)